MRSKIGSAALRAAPEQVLAQNGHPRFGRLVGFGDGGRVLVQVDGSAEAIPARRLLRSDRAFRRAVLERREVLLSFESGDPRRPVICGLLDPEESDADPQDGAERVVHPGLPAMVIEADADGRRVKVIAQDEIVFQCGAASITLRRNGRVIVRGTELDSEAAGTHRIKGGQVRLN